jgi:cytoskeletal protein RodZ
MDLGEALTMSTRAVDPKALASAKLMERRRHLRRLRRTVVTIAVALFVALWGVIFLRLLTGHDPVLSASAKSSAVTTSSNTATSGGGSSSTSSGSTSNGTSSSGTSSSGATSSGTSSVTTRAS